MDVVRSVYFINKSNTMHFKCFCMGNFLKEEEWVVAKFQRNDEFVFFELQWTILIQVLIHVIRIH